MQLVRYVNNFYAFCMIKRTYQLNKTKIIIFLKNRNKNISVNNFFFCNHNLNTNIFKHLHSRGNKYFPKVKFHKEINFLVKIKIENFNRNVNKFLKRILPTVFDLKLIKKMNIRQSLMELKSEWIDDVNFLLSSEKNISFSSFEENREFKEESGESSGNEILIDFPIIY